MKKKILFVLVLFIALTGFKNKEVETSGDFGITRALIASEGSLPVITKMAPNDDGRVIGYAGQIITFYLEYTANPAVTNIKIYKDGLLDKDQDVLYTTGTVSVKIENAPVGTSTYKIVLKNSNGSVERVFNVRIDPDPLAN